MSRTRAVSIALVLASAGCGILDPGESGREELEENRERWEAIRPVAYAMVIERRCFCPAPARGPVRVTVEATIPTGRVYADSGEVVPAELAPLFPTIDGLFDVLADAYARSAHEIRVSYDEGSGIPVDVWIDYQETMADEELGFSVLVPIDVESGS
jgi:hypothetical protein